MKPFFNYWRSVVKSGQSTLCEKCPNVKFFLVQILENTEEKTPYLGIFHAVQNIHFFTISIDVMSYTI